MSGVELRSTRNHTYTNTKLQFPTFLLLSILLITVNGDELPVSQFPLFTQVTSWIRTCASSETSLFITSFGCDDYTRAPCLCGNSASSLAVQSAIQDCISSGGEESSQQATGSMLWSSFCEVNLKQAATRTVGKPISVSGICTIGELIQYVRNIDIKQLH